MLRNEKWARHFLDSAEQPDSGLFMMHVFQHSAFQRIAPDLIEFVVQ